MPQKPFGKTQCFRDERTDGRRRDMLRNAITPFGAITSNVEIQKVWLGFPGTSAERVKDMEI